jgi:protein-L-isoaspartate(D-aspartate) O-methyltransferase
MVERQLRGRGVADERVLGAMRAIPREEFVPAHERPAAYRDDPIAIGCGQTISQPYMTALMAELLGLTGVERVLEVGTGSGYAAAVLGLLAAQVVTVEIVPSLWVLACANLQRTGHGGNVVAVCGDGSLGMPDYAPFDAISVAAGAPEIPHALVEQLADPGRLVIPVGERQDQDLLLVEKRDGRLHKRSATLCRFVPLRGGGGWR